jgi:hypothetical protein
MPKRTPTFDEMQAELLQELGFGSVLLNIAQAAKNLAKSGKLSQQRAEAARRLAVRLRQLDKEVSKSGDIGDFDNSDWDMTDVLIEIPDPNDPEATMLVFQPLL